MIETYVDSGVLIDAYRLTGPVGPSADAVLKDPNRSYVTSEFVRLEVLPKPTYYRRPAEITFYSRYFTNARHVTITGQVLQVAMLRAEMFGLNGMDALHIAAAEFGGATEFITTERATSPLLRVTTLHVISLHP